MSVVKVLIGDTVKVTWINSGMTTIDSGHVAVYNGSETLVDSGPMTSSGNGHYYKLHTIPNTPGWYAVALTAVWSSNTYKRRTRYNAVIEDVD